MEMQSERLTRITLTEEELAWLCALLRWAEGPRLADSCDGCKQLRLDILYGRQRA